MIAFVNEKNARGLYYLLLRINMNSHISLM